MGAELKESRGNSRLANFAHRVAHTAAVPWTEFRLDQLVILPGFSITETHVCVIWTSRGMLERARHGRNHGLRLVVDGKQKILADQYGQMVGNRTAVFSFFMNRRITSTRVLPTLQLFDAAWRVVLPWLQQFGQEAAVNYLRGVCFEEIQVLIPKPFSSWRPFAGQPGVFVCRITENRV